MPGGKASFCSSWLQGYDNNGHKISTWCMKKSQFEAYCSLCYWTFSVASRGNDQILQHSGGKKHSSIANLCFDKLLNIFRLGSDQSRLHYSPRPMKKISFKRIWSWSGQVCRYTLDAESCWVWLFPNIMMFSGNISSQFQLGLSKASYVLSGGFSPPILDETVEDSKNCGMRYTAIFEETTANQNRKRLEILKRAMKEDKLFPNTLPLCFLEALLVLTFYWISFKQSKKQV